MTDPHQPMPDFAEGDHFLSRLRATLHRRLRRRLVGTTLASALAAAWLVVVSFTALEHQLDEDIWEDYLLSQNEEATWLAVEEEAMMEVYLETLYQEDDLDVLLGELVELYGDDTWLKDLKLGG